MKHFLSFLITMTLILGCQQSFADAVIFSGSDVKALKSNLDLNGGAKVLSASSDPTSSATSAPKGSALLSTANGSLFLKQDAGSSTNWLKAIASSTGIASASQGGTGQSSYTKGDILAAQSSSVLNKLAVGTDGQFLVADSAATNGIKWSNIASNGNFQSKTTTYTALSTDGYITVDSSGGAWTLTLFSASGKAGQVLVVKKTSSDTNLVTIDANSTETIDGKLTIGLFGQYEAVRLISDGTNWIIDSVNKPAGLSASATLNTKGNNTNYEDCTSFSVPAGTWLLEGQVIFKVSGGATTSGDLICGISTTSGNSASGLTAGASLMQQNINTADGTSSSCYITGLRVTPTTSTTYYMKMKKDNGGANLQYACNITAIRLQF